MPHLSPMNWLIVPIFMIITLMALMSILWWHFPTKFPMISNLTSNSFSKVWNWW